MFYFIQCHFSDALIRLENKAVYIYFTIFHMHFNLIFSIFDFGVGC